MEQGAALCRNDVKIAVCPCLSPFAHGDCCKKREEHFKAEFLARSWLS